MFAIGAQYYRAPSPREENWERDIAAAREHGLNIMRSWVMWRWYNHIEGRYDFSELLRLHDIFEKNGMRLVFLIHLESPPAWLIDRYPQARYVDHEGKTLHPETMPSVSAGGFPGLCFHNEPVVEEAKNFIGRLVSEFSGSETVFAWEPHNEPQIEASRYGSGVYCYCDGTIRKFRLWLRERYGDVGNLNRAWTARFGAFDEISPPRHRRTWADWVDWRLFMSEALAEMEQWRIDAIRAHTRQKVITHIGSESSVNNDMAVCGFDDWRLAPQTDMYGVAGFPQVQSLGGLVSGISVIRSASRDKESWVAELQAGDYGLGFNRRSYRGLCPFCGSSGREAKGGKAIKNEVYKDPGEVTAQRLKMWSHACIAEGMKGILYWQYRCETFGQEYGFGLTELDGSPGPRLQMVKRLASVINEHQDLIRDAAPYPAESAVALSPVVYMMNSAANGCNDQIRNSIHGVFLAHWLNDTVIRFVRTDEEAVDDDYSPFKILYLPFPVWISRRSVQKLWAFVENGGTLVSEASLAQYGERFFSETTVPGMGLHELFGVKRGRIYSRDGFSFTFQGRPLRAAFYCETLEPAPGAEVAGVFEDGAPAAVVSRLGKGKTVYFGTNPFMEYPRSGDPALLQVVAGLNAEAGVRRPVHCSRHDVVARGLQVKGKTRMVVVYNTTDAPRQTTLTVSEPGAPIDMETGETPRAVKPRPGGAGIELELELEPYGSRMLRLD